MKQLFPIILALLIFVGCKSEIKKDKKPKDYLVLSGEVNNFKKRTIELTGFNFEKKINFNKSKKSFLDTLTHITPGHYTLRIGKRPVGVYLTSIDDLKLIVDAKKRREDPIFSGETAKINEYLTARYKKFGLILGNADKLFSLNEDAFLSKMDKYKSQLENLAESFNLPSYYLELEKRNIFYEFARNINNYQAYHRILYGDSKFEVSSNYPKDILNEVDFNNSTDYINSFSYKH